VRNKRHSGGLANNLCHKHQHTSNLEGFAVSEPGKTCSQICLRLRLLAPTLSRPFVNYYKIHLSQSGFPRDFELQASSLRLGRLVLRSIQFQTMPSISQGVPIEDAHAPSLCACSASPSYMRGHGHGGAMPHSLLSVQLLRAS
jgi:hypothetical protein